MRFPVRGTAPMHGRAINNLEEGWPETLTSLREAAAQRLISSTWRRRATRSRADGGETGRRYLGEAGIFISW